MKVLRRLSALLLIVSLAAGVAVLQPARFAHANTLTLCPANDQTIASAIASSSSGDTLDIQCPGFNNNNVILFAAPVEINKNITLDSSGSPKPITFDGGNTSQLFTVDTGKTLTLIGGSTPDVPGRPGTTLKLAHATHGPAITDTVNCGADNTSNVAGGAIFVSPGAILTVTNTTFTDDSVCAYGGAIADFGGTLNVIDSTFGGEPDIRNGPDHGNFTSRAGGGAIYIGNGSNATITGSTFDRNHVIDNGQFQGGSGGAIDVERGGSTTSLIVTNSTFWANTAFSSAGAIFAFNVTNDPSSNVTVINSTFADNSSNFSSAGSTFETGSASPSPSPIKLANSIIAAPQGDQQGCYSSSDITDEGNNVADSFSANCLSGAAGDLTTNPSLVGLGNWFGPTLTMPPQPNSPAIDHIPTSIGPPYGCPATDQRGHARPDNSESKCDAGAVEFDFTIRTPSVASISPTNVNAGSGDTTVTLTGTGNGLQTSYFSDYSVVNYTPPGGTAITLNSSLDSTDNRITATVPAADLTGGNNSPGAITVYTQPDGAPSTAQNLVIDPVIAGLQVTGDHASNVPLAGQMETSTTDLTLTVNGDGFCSIASCLSTVMMAVNNGTATPLPTTYVSGKLTATIPHASFQPGDTLHFSVSNADTGISSIVDESVVAPNPTPSLSPFSSPATYAGNPNPLSLTLTGGIFISSTTVNFGNLDTFTPSSITNNGGTLQVSVPSSDLQTAQDVDVTVTTPPAVTGYTDGGTSNSHTFHIDQPPSISSLVLNPTETSTSDMSLTVNGGGFCDSSKAWCLSSVYWSDASAGSPYKLSITNFSTSQLTVTVPKALVAQINQANVSVNNADGGQSGQVQESVLAPNPAPTLTSILPTALGASPGTHALTLAGTGFVAASVVVVSPSTCAPSGITPDSFTNTTIHVTFPAGCLDSPGSLTVGVFNPPAVSGFGDGGTSGTKTLTINPAPTLSTVSPTSLETSASSATLTVTGTTFQNGAAVAWVVGNKVTLLSTTWNSATKLTATVPAFLLGSPSTAQVDVVNPDDGTSSQLPVQVLAPNPAASVTGAVNVAFLEGDLDQPLSLTGANFVNGADVKWTMNGVTHSLCTANPCTVLSSSSLTATIPTSLLTSAGTAMVSVVNPPAVAGYSDGGSASSIPITVNNPVPTTIGVTPNGIAIGSTSTVLTVTGTNFVSTSVVKWNGAALSSTYVNTTTLKATVPSSSLTATAAGIVTVVNPAPGGGASNAQVVEVTKSGATTSESLVGIGSAGLGGASSTPGSLNATTDGNGLVAVARYSTAPGTATFNTPENGTYFDVYIQGSAPPTATTTATIVDCTLNGGNAAYYQDPVTLAWKAVSNQSQTPAGCITMTITNSTSPSLSQMRATGFGIGKDTEPPTTAASVSSAANGSGVYQRPITVNLTATDNAGGSGIRTIYYALPPPGTSCVAATYTPVAGSTASVAITQPAGAGVMGHTLCYYAQDAAGNNETAHTAVYTIDTTERVMQIGHASFLSASGAHTVTVNAVPGDLLVAELTENGASTTAPTLKAGTQSFSLDVAPSPLGGKTQALVFRLNPTSAVSSVTVTTPFYNAYDIWVFDIANPVASALDASGAAFRPTANSMSISTTGPTTIANDFVIAAAVTDGAVALSAPVGYTSPTTLVGSTTKSRVAYSLTNSAATQTANFGTLTTKANIGVAIAAYGGT